MKSKVTNFFRAIDECTPMQDSLLGLLSWFTETWHNYLETCRNFKLSNNRPKRRKLCSSRHKAHRAMAITDVLSMIFHFQVTRVSSSHMRSFFLLITHVQEIFGHAFAEWVQHNFDMFPHIITNTQELIQLFNYNGCIFPSSQRHLQEHLITIISYSHEACFHPDMNQFRNFFDERQPWTYSTIKNAA